MNLLCPIFTSRGFLAKSASLFVLMAGCHALAASPYVRSIDPATIGAQVPYPRYEAENATLTGAAATMGPNRNVGDLGGEASGSRAVKLINTGDGVEWTATDEANSSVIRHSIPDTADGAGQEATISLLINGVKKDTVTLTSKYAWLYGPEGDPKNTPSLGLAGGAWNSESEFPVSVPVSLHSRPVESAG